MASSRLSRLTDRLSTSRGRLWMSIGVLVAINTMLAAAYIWSRGGETAHVRLEADGNHFAAYLNGKLQAQGTLDGPASGGIALFIADTTDIPSLPQPRGIDRVRVSDLKTGDVLFDDDFSVAPKKGAVWTEVSGPAVVSNGVVGANHGQITLRMDGREWQDYAVDVTFKNITNASVTVRSQADGSGVDYNFRPFRHYDNRLALLDKGRATTQVNGYGVEMPRSQTMKSMLSMTLRPYPYALTLLALGAVAVVVLMVGGRLIAPAFRGKTADLAGGAPWLFVTALAGLVFGVTLYFNYSYGSHMPHIPDEVSYLFQAKLFASGRLAASPPPAPASFDFFFPSLILISHGKWASVYPFGHPLMLAIGVRIGAVWLIPPLVGAGCVVLTFAVGRRVYNARTGMLAALVLAGSPFFLMAASNFMSHNTAAFYLLLCTLFLALADKRPVLFPLLSGVFFGLLFNTRPLTSLALVAPFGVMLLSFAIPPGRRKIAAKQIAAFVVGGLLMLVAYWLYNVGSSGTFGGGYQNGGDVGAVVGFGGKNTVATGMQNEQTQLAFLSLVLNGWPRYIGLMFVLLPFMLGTRKRWDWFLLASSVSVVGVYTLYAENGVAYGPRYWYEAVPFLVLLTARGAETAAEALAGGARYLQRRFSGRDGYPLWAGVAVTYGLVIFLVLLGSYRWVFDDVARWRVDQMPARAQDLRGYNGVDDRLVRLVHDMNLHHALVLTAPCSNWQCIGSVFWMNSPSLDTDVVFAKDLGPENQKAFDAYPDRVVYSSVYLPPAIFPYGTTPDATPQAGDAAVNAPKAGNIPKPTPVPTSTPDPRVATARDEQRRRDAATFVSLLGRYYDAHGAYPTTGGVQSLCTYDFDEGCKLREIQSPLPRDPSPDGQYWYESDGRQFVVYASLEEVTTEADCTVPKPGHLAYVEHLLCVTGRPPGQ